MRTAYHDEIDAVTNRLVEMTRLVGSSVGRATQALLDADQQLAEQVISADAAVDALYHDVEERIVDLIARQQPVASDLRTILAGLRMVADLERAGDNATHIAEIARRRSPGRAIPDDLSSTVLEMGQVAQRIVAKVGSAIAGRDVSLALEVERDDDVMDGLHARLYKTILSGDWPGGVEAAIDASQCSRHYERFADHAVSVARRVVYVVTGERPVVELGG